MKFLQVSFVFIFAIFLVACTGNPAKHRENEPNNVFYSEKSARDVSICISDKYDETSSNRNIILKPTKSGYTVQVWHEVSFLMVFDVGESNSYLVDIHEVDNGSEVKFFYGGPRWQPSWGGVSRPVEQCL